jgi:hypothetical protein
MKTIAISAAFTAANADAFRAALRPFTSLSLTA